MKILPQTSCYSGKFKRTCQSHSVAAFQGSLLHGGGLVQRSGMQAVSLVESTSALDYYARRLSYVQQRRSGSQSARAETERHKASLVTFRIVFNGEDSAEVQFVPHRPSLFRLLPTTPLSGFDGRLNLEPRGYRVLYCTCLHVTPRM